MKSQSAGLLESVFRGKQDPFVEDGGKEMVMTRPFLGQSRRRDWDKRERRTGPNNPHGSAATRSGLQLALRIVGYNAQVNIAIRTRLTARMGAKKVNRTYLRCPAHRLKALCQ
jgi:hypothetical protein